MRLKDTIKIEINPLAKNQIKEVAKKVYTTLLKEKTKFDIEELQLLSVWIDSCLTSLEQDVIRKKVEAEQKDKPKKVGILQYNIRVDKKTYWPIGHTLEETEQEALQVAEMKDKTVFVWDNHADKIASVVSQKGVTVRL